MKISLEDAIDKLCEELKNDPEYYNTWKMNISNSFIDEYSIKNNGTFVEFFLKKADQAAKKFLDTLIYLQAQKHKSSGDNCV